MDNFNLDELMDLAEAYVGPMVDAIYRRLIERDFGCEETKVVHGEEEDKSAGTLLIPRFQEEADDDK